MASRVPPASLRARLLLLAASVGLNLALAEVAIRIWRPGLHDTARLAQQQQASRIAELIRFTGDSALPYVLRPGLATRFGEAPLHTSAQGHRIADPSRPAKPRPPKWPRRRLAIVGDSNGFGWKVAYEQTWFERLRQELEEELRVAIELRNFSVPGYNTLQQDRVFHQDVLPWEPDLVLWHYCHNDAAPLDTRLLQGPEDGNNFLRSALWKTLVRMARRPQPLPVDPVNRRLGNAFYSGPLWEAHLAVLQDVARTSNEQQVPMLVFLFDTQFDTQPDSEAELHLRRLHEPLRNRLRKMGLPFLDLADSTRSHLAEQGWPDLQHWWISNQRPVDVHPNAEAQAFLAEQLNAFLLERPRFRKTLAR